MKSKVHAISEEFCPNDSQVLRVHAKNTCKGDHCAIHNPSDHHMRDWKLIWRNDRGCFERLCPEHGVGHPDPDDLNHDGIHGCCGCCHSKKGGGEKGCEATDNVYEIKINEVGLSTIINALECYSRLGLNQFMYCLEHNPKFMALDYDKRAEIESYLRREIDNTNYGIYHPDVESFTKAFDIKKECELFRAIATEPIMKNHTNVYDGSFNDGPHIPTFYKNGEELKHEIKIPVPKALIKKMKAAAKKANYGEIWKLVDSFNDVKGSCLRLIDDYCTLVIEKPYK